jgi:hypothetical protein
MQPSLPPWVAPPCRMGCTAQHPGLPASRSDLVAGQRLHHAWMLWLSTLCYTVVTPQPRTSLRMAACNATIPHRTHHTPQQACVACCLQGLATCASLRQDLVFARWEEDARAGTFGHTTWYQRAVQWAGPGGGPTVVLGPHAVCSKGIALLTRLCVREIDGCMCNCVCVCVGGGGVVHQLGVLSCWGCLTVNCLDA